MNPSTLNYRYYQGAPSNQRLFSINSSLNQTFSIIKEKDTTQQEPNSIRKEGKPLQRVCSWLGRIFSWSESKPALQEKIGQAEMRCRTIEKQLAIVKNLQTQGPLNTQERPKTCPENSRVRFCRPVNGFGERNPMFNQPKPCFEQPKTCFDRHCPVSEQAEPVYYRPETVYEQPKPDFAKKHVPSDQPKPFLHQHDTYFTQLKTSFDQNKKPTTRTKIGLDIPIIGINRPTREIVWAETGMKRPRTSNDKYKGGAELSKRIPAARPSHSVDRSKTSTSRPTACTHSSRTRPERPKTAQMPRMRNLSRPKLVAVRPEITNSNDSYLSRVSKANQPKTNDKRKKKCVFSKACLLPRYSYMIKQPCLPKRNKYRYQEPTLSSTMKSNWKVNYLKPAIPFVVGKSVNKTHHLGLKMQETLSLLRRMRKGKNPVDPSSFLNDYISKVTGYQSKTYFEKDQKKQTKKLKPPTIEEDTPIDSDDDFLNIKAIKEEYNTLKSVYNQLKEVRPTATTLELDKLFRNTELALFCKKDIRFDDALYIKVLIEKIRDELSKLCIAKSQHGLWQDNPQSPLSFLAPKGK